MAPLLYVVICLCCLLATSGASSFLTQHMSVYQSILQEKYKTLDVVVDVKAVKFLLELHDSDAACLFSCEKYLYSIVGEGISWNQFEKVVDAIYGPDAVSSDPYQPQEVHLSLGSDPTSMHVMWVTLGFTTDPIVEYAPFESSEGWSSASVQVASNSTYLVPKKWLGYIFS